MNEYGFLFLEKDDLKPVMYIKYDLFIKTIDYFYTQKKNLKNFLDILNSLESENLYICNIENDEFPFLPIYRKDLEDVQSNNIVIDINNISDSSYPEIILSRLKEKYGTETEENIKNVINVVYNELNIYKRLLLFQGLDDNTSPIDTDSSSDSCSDLD